MREGQAVPRISREALLAVLPKYAGQIATDRSHFQGSDLNLACDVGMASGYSEEEVDRLSDQFYEELKRLFGELTIWSFDIQYPWGLGWVERFWLLEFEPGHLALVHLMEEHPLYVPLLGRNLTGQDVLNSLSSHLKTAHFDGEVCEFPGILMIHLKEGESYPVNDPDFVIKVFNLEGVLGLAVTDPDILASFHD